jgi:hypothetical protein
MLGQDRDDHGWVFRTLTFVNGRCEGESESSVGVEGISQTAPGVAGRSPHGIGVLGESLEDGIGVMGSSATDNGGVFSSDKAAQLFLIPNKIGPL